MGSRQLAEVYIVLCSSTVQCHSTQGVSVVPIVSHSTALSALYVCDVQGHGESDKGQDHGALVSQQPHQTSPSSGPWQEGLPLPTKLVDEGHAVDVNVPQFCQSLRYHMGAAGQVQGAGGGREGPGLDQAVVGRIRIRITLCSRRE